MTETRPTPPPRVGLALPLGVAALAAVAGVAALAFGVSAGVLVWPTALIAAMVWIVAALGIGTVILLQRVLRQTARLSRTVERVNARLEKQQERGAAERTRIAARLDATAEALRKIRRDDLPAARAEARERTRELQNFVRTKFGNLTQHVTRQGRVDYEQVVAWNQLRDLLKPERAMPSLRGWAAAPDVMCLLVETIRDRRPRLVVECGSGGSSVWLGLALRRFGGGRLVSLENDERCAALTRDLIAAHGLGDLVEVRHAPLTPWSGGNGAPPTPWYDLAAVDDLADIDLLFVDGPRGKDADQARYPAGPVLIPRCSGRAVVVLDDADRDDERVTSDRWIDAFQFLHRSMLDTEKGTHVFRRD